MYAGIIFQQDDLLADDNEPYENCRQCDVFLPMSKLSKHIMECAGATTQKRYTHNMHVYHMHVRFSHVECIACV